MTKDRKIVQTTAQLALTQDQELEQCVELVTMADTIVQLIVLKIWRMRVWIGHQDRKVCKQQNKRLKLELDNLFILVLGPMELALTNSKG